ncbi:hypothetical protein, partial [Francisella tularensis]|uniref:hypothetical protein n=1 Tax=Francisella tularensis TaxID=263 RepID=UPI001F11830E
MIIAFLDNQISIFLSCRHAEGGLSEINVWGNMPYAMRIYPNKTRMAEYGITPTELATAIG